MEITIKTNWDEVSINEWQELVSIMNSDSELLNKELMILEVLTDMSYDELNNLTITQLKQLLAKTKFLRKPPEGKLKYEFILGGEKYIPKLMIGDYEAGRFVDIQHLLKDGASENLNLILACILDKKIEYPKYKIWKQNTIEGYDKKDLKSLGELVGTDMNVENAIGLSSFFLKNFAALWKTIEDSLEGEKKKEWMDLMKEATKKSKKASQATTHGKSQSQE